MATAPKIVVVPEGGICLRALARELGVCACELHRLMGAELGAPRDYDRRARR